MSYWNKGNAVKGDTGRTVPADVTFGVELEVSDADGHDELQGRTAFGCKRDGSVNGDGLEFVSPVLAGDAGYAVVENLLDYAANKGWHSDSSCGFHLHIGVRDYTPQAQKAVALAYTLTAELWGRFVSPARQNNSYCRKHFVTPEYIENAPERDYYGTPMEYIASEADNGPDGRYCWINFSSYRTHGTVEVRLHNGTVNKAEVLNWIRAHTLFVAAVREMTVAQVKATFAGKSVAGMFRALEQLWQSRDVSEFYRKRAATVNKPVHL